MKCEKCPADSALGCTAGVKPYQLRSGNTGCAWNLRIIKKHMNQSKPTNYDSIVRKTPEEMARWIWAVQSEIKHEDLFSTDGWYVWLMQEATE